MRSNMVRALIAMAAGGTALLTVGLTAATAAAQTGGTHAASYPTVATSSRAGYMDSGRWFRFVGTTVKVPGAGAYDQYARVVLKGQNVSAVTLAIKPGGGAGSVGWAVGVAPFGMGGGSLAIAPAVGDTVTINLYYDKTGGGVTATATDLTTKATAAKTISAGTVIDTVNGQAGGQVVMSPSFLFNSNANFGVWIRDWLMKTTS